MEPYPTPDQPSYIRYHAEVMEKSGWTGDISNYRNLTPNPWAESAVDWRMSDERRPVYSGKQGCGASIPRRPKSFGQTHQGFRAESEVCGIVRRWSFHSAGEFHSRERSWHRLLRRPLPCLPCLPMMCCTSRVLVSECRIVCFSEHKSTFPLASKLKHIDWWAVLLNWNTAIVH